MDGDPIILRVMKHGEIHIPNRLMKKGIIKPGDYVQVILIKDVINK